MLYRTIRYTGKWFKEGGVGQEGALKLRVLMTDWSHIYHIFHFASFYFCIFGFSLLLMILRHTVCRIYFRIFLLLFYYFAFYYFAFYYFAFFYYYVAFYYFRIFSRNISILTSTIGLPTWPMDYGPWIMDHIVPNAFSRLLDSKKIDPNANLDVILTLIWSNPNPYF